MNMETVVKVNGQVKRILGNNPNGSKNLERGQTLYLDKKNAGRVHGRLMNGKFYGLNVSI